MEEAKSYGKHKVLALMEVDDFDGYEDDGLFCKDVGRYVEVATEWPARQARESGMNPEFGFKNIAVYLLEPPWDHLLQGGKEKAVREAKEEEPDWPTGDFIPGPASEDTGECLVAVNPWDDAKRYEVVWIEKVQGRKRAVVLGRTACREEAEATVQIFRENLNERAKTKESG